MMWIIHLLVDAALLFVLAGILNGVKVKSYGTAILVALVVALLNFTIGWFIRFPLNLATLFLLQFLVKGVVTAIMIMIANAIFSGFSVKNFSTALLLSFLMAILSSIVYYIF